jgi:hypothetical protein
MNGGKYEGEKFDRMATKLAMPAPLAKSAILSGVDRPGLGECQLRADSPLPAQFRTLYRNEYDDHRSGSF